MAGLSFFENVHETVPLVRKGVDGKVTQGCSITKGSHGPGQAAWVAAGTLILGCHPNGSSHETESSSAVWAFAIPKRLRSKIDSAAVLVCCMRLQGGLHSATPNRFARVLVNDEIVDEIGLKYTPAGHTDYFHRTPPDDMPDIRSEDMPDIRQLKNCRTKYSFGVNIEYLTKLDGSDCMDHSHEKVCLITDPGVRWDIDYVVLVVTYAKKQMSKWSKVVIGAVVSAIVGLMVNRGWSALARLVE